MGLYNSICRRDMTKCGDYLAKGEKCPEDKQAHHTWYVMNPGSVKHAIVDPMAFFGRDGVWYPRIHDK